MLPGSRGLDHFRRHDGEGMTRWVGIEKLHLSPLRPPGPLPEVPRSLARLVDSHGPVDPVVVRTRPLGFEILSNAETWLAAQRAGWHEVPIELRDEIDDAKAREILGLSGRSQGTDPIEEARQFEAELARRWHAGLRRHGAITRLAREHGRSRSYVAHALRLLRLPQGVLQYVSSGRLSAGHARALVTLRDARRQERVAERILREGLSVRATEALVHERVRARADDGRSKRDDPDIRRLERVLSEVFGSATRLDTRAGRLIIDYGENLDVLDGVLARLGLDEGDW